MSTGTIQILPPFYLRLPFLLLLGAVLLITGLLVYRFVTMRRHEALLEHQVRERTAELHAMADRYHSMIQNAVFGIFRARPDGTLLAVNPALVRMLNYESEAELQQVDLVEEVFVSPERWRTLASTLDPGAELEGTAFRWKRRDGSVILVRLSGLVSQSSGEGPVLEMIAENVTELERNRAAALEAEKLRVARQVAVTVAHEFNNPLAVLLAAYDLHVRKLARTADRDTRERISAIPRAVERMRDLVNRLVTINRVREATYTGGTTFLNLNESSGEGEEDSPPPSADPE